jgi:tetratricopeptide (TPR) repeat protein
MKKLIMIAAGIALSFTTMAQATLDEGVKMYQYKKYQSAQKVLSQLAAKDPIANYYLGLCYLESNNLKQASEQFEKYPEDPANISGTARVAFASKDATKGITIAKALAAKAKKKDIGPLVYAAESITYTDGGDNQQAIQWYKDALTKNPNDIEAHLGMGDTYRKMTGGGGEAMNNYEFIIEKANKNSLVLSRIGDLWYDARNYASALEFYGKAKDADNTNPLPYKSLALAYQRTAKYDIALQNIKKYIELSDNELSDKINYAEILYLAKSYCDAAKLAEELNNQTVPAEKKVTILGILGFSQAECGDSINAQKNLSQYFKLREAKYITPYAYIDYGKLWLRLNNLDSASFYYQKGINADTAKNKTEIYRQIADAFRMKKDYCKAADWYDNLIKSNPATQPTDYFWTVVMYYYCKDFTKGLDAANRFKTTHADQPSAYYWHGKLVAVNDPEAADSNALNSFNKYLELLGPAAIKEPKKKSEVSAAYSYILLYYYNKKDKEQTKVYTDKLKEVDPAAEILKQLEAAGATPNRK